MMTVSGFTTREEAAARIPYYQSRGYRVALVEHRSANAGSIIQLQCEVAS